jgi:hypothetical protein
MRFDSLVRLIESSDFTSFREIALHILSARGFQTPAIRDGWSDGGSDVAVYAFPMQPLQFAIQISVESDWRRKLRQDARKAKTQLGTTDFLYVSSHRIAEVEFQAVADELVREGIRATRMDSQGIASLTVEKNLTFQVLRAIDIDIPNADQNPATPREVAAYAFAFFGAEANDFRARVVERTALTLLANSSAPIPRGELLDTLVTVLQLSRGQRALVSGAVDRLLQQQAIVTDGGALTCSIAERARLSAAFALRVADLQNLKKSIEGFAATRGIRLMRDRKGFAETVVEHLGAIVMAQAQLESGALTKDHPRSEMQARLRERLHSLNAALDTYGLPAGARGDDVMALTQIGMKSSFGRELLAGEIFLSLTRLGTSQFIEAAANAREFRIVLDASVAIPVLCAKLHGTAEHRFFLAAQHLLEQTRTHGVSLVVPEPYLEECATHLLSAARDYMPFIEQDADLRGSKNAYVAHFKLLNPEGTKQQFRKYLGAFGLTAGIEPDRRGRNRLMGEIGKIFRQYGIRTLSGRSRADLRKEAEEALVHAMNDLSAHGDLISREPILIRHDAVVIALLNGEAIDSAGASVLCSWDRLIFHAHERGAASFDVMDPAALGDMMSVALASDAETQLLGPTVLAMQMSDEEVERGAAVWDTIANLESGRLTDGELLQKAKEFKAEFLAAHARRVDRKAIQDAWLEWKGQPAGEK